MDNKKMNINHATNRDWSFVIIIYIMKFVREFKHRPVTSDAIFTYAVQFLAQK